MRKTAAILCFVLFVCCSLTGCDYWQEDDGSAHFMLFGERGPIKDGKPWSEEASARSEKASASQRSDAGDGFITSSASPEKAGIKGIRLKQGWTSEDKSILKGKNVSVTRETELFRITAKEKKEVVLHLDAVRKSGEYQVVLIRPDQSETVLYETHAETKAKKVILNQGTNSIWIRSNAVVFQSIDLSIDGIEASDF